MGVKAGLKKAMGMGCSRMTFLCVTTIQGKVIAGTSSGGVVHFSDGIPTNVEYGHEGPVNTICASGDGFLTGGKDGKLILWALDFSQVQSYDMNDVAILPECWEPRRVRSICQGKDKILVGSYQGE